MLCHQWGTKTNFKISIHILLRNSFVLNKIWPTIALEGTWGWNYWVHTLSYISANCIIFSFFLKVEWMLFLLFVLILTTKTKWLGYNIIICLWLLFYNKIMLMRLVQTELSIALFACPQLLNNNTPSLHYIIETCFVWLIDSGECLLNAHCTDGQYSSSVRASVRGGGTILRRLY